MNNVICNVCIDSRSLDTAEVVQVKRRNGWGEWDTLITPEGVRDLLSSNIPYVITLGANGRQYTLYSRGALPYVNECVN